MPLNREAGQNREATRPERWNLLALLLSILAIVLAAISLYSHAGPATSPSLRSALDRIRSMRVIRAGYSGFRPYTIINLKAQPNSPDRVSGFCVDMINEIAARQSPPWHVEWHQVTFETLKADMESGRFDVFADAVYQTAPRASEFGYTLPWGYFGVAVGIVRKGDSRFVDFADIDRPGVRVALAEGWTSTEYARQHLARATLKSIAVADDPFIPLQEVIAGRADIALQDVPTVVQFAREHAREVDPLWLNRPPTRVPAGFMVQRNDYELRHFLDVSIKVLEADGTLDRLDQKWGGLNEFPVLGLRPGAGLKAR